MSTERIFLRDPFCFEFTATVIGTRQMEDGRLGVTLDRTCFFPTGGGQDHDTGTLNSASVVDVLNEDSGDILHVVEGLITPGHVVGKVDRIRRLSFMQHHSAQHLVSAILDLRLGLETVSSHIGIQSPTTIDIPTTAVEQSDIRLVEDEANAIIFQDRPIRFYSIQDDQIATVPFRRPPQVTGEIRVVEIEDMDHSACGGTHCTRTGMIGVVKILRTERRGERTRIHLVAGTRALEYLHNYHSIITNAARQLDTSPESIPEAVARQSEALRRAQKELEDLKAEKATWEIKDLLTAARVLGSNRVVTRTFRDRTPIQVRALAGLLQHEPQVIAVLAVHDGARLSLLVSCGADTGISANELIRGLLAESGGRGGGDAKLAQGGSTMSREHLEAMLAGVPDRILGLLKD